MNLKIPLRVGRTLIVLALIVALLGSSIPVPARAAGFSPGLFALDATNIIVAGARALGIAPGSSPSAFNQMVADAKTGLFAGVSPLVDVWLDYGQSGFRSFLSADFLARLLSFMLDAGWISASSRSLTSYTESVGSTSYSIESGGPSQIFVCLGTSNGSVRAWRAILFGTAPFKINGKTESSSRYKDYQYIQLLNAGFSALPSTSCVIVDCGNASTTNDFLPYIEAAFTSSSVTTSQDLTLDSVSSTLSGAAYTDWTSGAVTQEGQPFVPVSIPSISDSTAIFTQTQAQAQAGTIPESVVDEIVAGAEVVPETGTIADVITAVRALGADIVAAVQAIPAAIADIFSPAADPEVYQVDLKDFFPFCIPFDLFDIVTAFAAEPEAPVFEWPISVPRWGFEYMLKVDLQEWEDIASLFRTLELTIFCVGLAIVTREKFLRS